MLRHGQVLNNRYVVAELVGHGGMSLVYRAHDEYENREVAIKVLREQFAGDDDFIARFHREAQAVSGLSQKNIVSVYSVEQQDGLHFLVMEMVDGKNLKEILRLGNPLPKEALIKLVPQICDAISHAHQKGIIHRDIKPHNVMLKSDGTIKVADFGIARAASSSTVTHSRGIMGSVHYFSPEQARGEIADERSDVYSLGVLIYELATGVLPFEGDSAIGVAMQKIQKDPVPPRDINPEINNAMEQVILRAMKRDPKYRYQAVEELKEDFLAACVHNQLVYEPVVDQTGDTIGNKAIANNNRNNRAAGRNRRRIIITTVIALIVFMGFALGMYMSLNLWSEPKEIELPDFTNTALEETLNSLTNLGLKGVVEKRLHHNDIPIDYVISQEPAHTTLVKQNSNVTLVVSDGPVIVSVPDLSKKPEMEAIVELQNLGLVLGDTKREHNANYAAGTVMSQEPKALEQVPKGSAVSITISQGIEPKYLTLPSLVGMNVNEAKEALNYLGLTVGTVRSELSWSYAADIVIGQNPAAESQVQEGSAVGVTISNGPGPS